MAWDPPSSSEQQQQGWAPPTPGEAGRAPAAPTGTPAPGGGGAVLASAGQRVGAALIDLLVTFVLLGLFSALFGDFTTSDDGAEASVEGGGALALAAAIVVYYFLTEWLLGGTLGKLALGLRVVMAEDGRKAGPGAVAIRTALRIVDGLLLYLVAFVTVLATPNNQRLGDLVAKTLVVKR